MKPSQSGRFPRFAALPPLSLSRLRRSCLARLVLLCGAVYPPVKHVMSVKDPAHSRVLPCLSVRLALLARASLRASVVLGAFSACFRRCACRLAGSALVLRARCRFLPLVRLVW